jgi:carboxylesterase type B
VDYIVNTLYPPVFDGSLGYTNNFERGSLIVSEGVFTCNTNYLSRAYGNKTYSYLFAIPPAIHGQDVAYTYFQGGAASTSPTGVTNTTIAIALQEFITSFAENGVPDAMGVKQFNMYGPDATVLELNVTGIEDVRDSNANARCAWWQKALY